MSIPNTWLELTPDEEREAFRANPCSAADGASCQGKIHIAVFFDGIGLSVFSPRLPISNVGRLYTAFPRSALGTLLRIPVYIDGLGTDMNLSRYQFDKEQAGQIGKKMLKHVTIDPITGKPKKMAQDIAKSVLSGTSVKDAVTGAVKEVPGQLKDGIIDAARHPVKAGVGVVKNAAGNIVRAVLDNVDPVRDSKFMFDAFNLGVAPRLSDAMTKLKSAITSTQIKLQEIQVSVYGCDWGGGLARAFLNNLCKEGGGSATSNSLQWTLGDKRKIPLVLTFVGLFDSVGYRSDWLDGTLASLIPMIGLKNTVSDDMELPRAVKRSAHSSLRTKCVGACIPRADKWCR